jgi:hypothetical protein
MPCCNGRDTGRDIPGSVRRLTFTGSLFVRKMKESVESRESNGRLRLATPSCGALCVCSTIAGSHRVTQSTPFIRRAGLLTERLEPCEARVSCTVPRGEEGREPLALPGLSKEPLDQ